MLECPTLIGGGEKRDTLEPASVAVDSSVSTDAVVAWLPIALVSWFRVSPGGGLPCLAIPEGTLDWLDGGNDRGAWLAEFLDSPGGTAGWLVVTLVGAWLLTGTAEGTVAMLVFCWLVTGPGGSMVVGLLCCWAVDSRDINVA